MGPQDNLECKETQELSMLSKAQEFFQTCDTEGKGFIARKDMQVRGLPTRYAKWYGSSCLGLGVAPVGAEENAIYSSLEGSVSPNSTGSQISRVHSYSGFCLLSHSEIISFL